MSELLPPADVVHLLDEFFQQHLPITRYLNMRSHAFSAERFSLAIDLQPSLNDKLTAFGGSLYCLCVMNCWGMVYLQGRRRGFNPNMVVHHAEIDYLAPVDDDVIVATCEQADESYWDQVYRNFDRKGKARCEVASTILSGDKTAVRFSGKYAMIGHA